MSIFEMAHLVIERKEMDVDMKLRSKQKEGGAAWQRPAAEAWPKAKRQKSSSRKCLRVNNFPTSLYISSVIVRDL